MPTQPRPNFVPHAFNKLKADNTDDSRRPFNSRGISVKRCPQCLLGEATCICQFRKPQACRVDWVLVLHRDEIVKPTNTGRLIADLYPEHTHAFRWDRTQPDEALLTLLKDPARECLIVFPCDEKSDGKNKDISPTLLEPYTAHRNDNRRLTLVLLDATWKQARKMYNHSPWLQNLPHLDLRHLLKHEAVTGAGNYQVRKAPKADQFSTAEAAAMAFTACGETQHSQDLLDYFQVFNAHYVAMRLNRQPKPTDAHARILAKNNAE